MISVIIILSLLLLLAMCACVLMFQRDIEKKKEVKRLKNECDESLKMVVQYRDSMLKMTNEIKGLEDERKKLVVPENIDVDTAGRMFDVLNGRR